MSYPNIVAHVAEIMTRAPLCGGENQKPAELVIDDTGPGRSVGDLFIETGLRSIIRVTITAGSEVTAQGGNRWNVAKSALISRFDALLHTGELKIAEGLPEAEALKAELQEFRRKLSETGKATFAARVGKHDDLLLAVCIGAWWITRPPPAVAQFTTYGLGPPGQTTFVTGEAKPVKWRD
jgi:hypothetical protein